MANADVIQSYLAAWNGHDPARIAGHFASNGVREWHVMIHPMIGGPTRFEGPQDIEGGVRVFMDAVPDLTVDTVQLTETDGGAMLEWRVRGKHTGAWGGWTGQGEEVDFGGASVYRIDGDKILEERMYFDPDVMAKNWTPPQG